MKFFALFLLARASPAVAHGGHDHSSAPGWTFNPWVTVPLGLLLIVVGVILSIPGVPGQGLLTIVVGVMLLDIPGKHRLVRAVVRRKGVLKNLNRLRASFGRPPLVIDEKKDAA